MSLERKGTTLSQKIDQVVTLSQTEEIANQGRMTRYEAFHFRDQYDSINLQKVL